MTFDVIYADPPWSYPSQLFGVSKLADGTYRQGQPISPSDHYPCMTDEDIWRLPVRDLAADKAALFLWATCPRLDMAMETMLAWGFHFRGVAFVWVKTRLEDGQPYGAKGPTPAFVSPVSELVLVGATTRKGRPFPLEDYTTRQIVMAPRGEHSAKPLEVRRSIERLCGNRPRVELFAREAAPGWHAWGTGLGSPSLEDWTREASA